MIENDGIIVDWQYIIAIKGFITLAYGPIVECMARTLPLEAPRDYP
jgi:hypothetical protein